MAAGGIHGGTGPAGRPADRWHAAPWPVAVVPAATAEEAEGAMRDVARLLDPPYRAWVAETARGRSRGPEGPAPSPRPGEVSAP